MVGYIYQIINKVNGLRYIGKTINLDQRKNKHFSQLKANSHINKKLQSAWNKYGEENFDFTYETFEIESNEELNILEKLYIRKFNSFENGYNLTEGGDGGEVRNKLNYEQFCLVFFGCQWKGLTVKIGEYLKVDSACISAILREVSYNNFRQRALQEPEEVKIKFQEQFKEIFNIPKDKKPDDQRVPSHLTEDEYFYCLCIASCYSRGIEQALANYFKKHKSFLSNGMKSAKTQGKAYQAKQRFLKLSIPEIEQIGQDKFEEWDIQSYTNTILTPTFNGKWRQ